MTEVSVTSLLVPFFAFTSGVRGVGPAILQRCSPGSCKPPLVTARRGARPAAVDALERMIVDNCGMLEGGICVLGWACQQHTSFMDGCHLTP